jgi:hypothetical protein
MIANARKRRKMLGHGADLDDQVIREVLGLDLAAFLPP